MASVVEGKMGALADLCARHQVYRLELFGSAARRDFDTQSSDIDFVVEFREMTPREHADAYFGLLEELEALFGRPVDLVERRAIKNPYFLQSVDQDRVTLYDAA